MVSAIIEIGIKDLMELAEREWREEMKNRAVVLLSGGMDSTVCAYIASKKHRDLYFLSFDYGQLHRKEIEFAKQTAIRLGGIEHRIVRLDFNQWISSPLLGQGEIPEGIVSGIAPTWVPQRNAIFLAIAFSYAELVSASAVFIGVSQVDFSGYPDCREEFINSIEDSLNLAGGKSGSDRIKIEAPLMFTSKAEEVKVGERLRVPWENTWTCYRGEEKACGSCPSCSLRLSAFKEAGIVDPIEYKEVE